MRKVIKLILKALALPLIASVMLIQWIGIFLTGLAGGIFGMLSFLFALSAVASFLFGIASGAEALKMLAVGFALFILPHIAERIIIGITAISCNLGEFIRS